VPLSLLVSAFGDSWQQPGFKVQLRVYVYVDGACIAGGGCHGETAVLDFVSSRKTLTYGVQKTIVFRNK
jgi:hypothetical protein